MKRAVLLLITTTIALVLIACGGDGENESDTPRESNTQETDQVQTADVTLDEANRMQNEYGHFSAIVPETGGSAWSYGSGRQQQNVDFSVDRVISTDDGLLVAARFDLFTEDIDYGYYTDTGFAQMSITEKFEFALGYLYDTYTISDDSHQVEMNGFTATVYDFTATVEDDGIDGRFNGPKSGFVATFESNGYSYIACGWHNETTPEYAGAPMRVFETVQLEFE